MKASEDEIQKALIVIREPIWKTASVGVAERKITKPGFFMRVDYVGKDGAKAYPATYWIDWSKAVEFPTQTIRTRNGFGIVLRVIPIAQFEMVEVTD